MDAWAAVLSQIIQEFSQPVSVVWLEKELALANGKRDQVVWKSYFVTVIYTVDSLLQ